MKKAQIRERVFANGSCFFQWTYRLDRIYSQSWKMMRDAGLINRAKWDRYLIRTKITYHLFTFGQVIASLKKRYESG